MAQQMGYQVMVRTAWHIQTTNRLQYTLMQCVYQLRRLHSANEMLRCQNYMPGVRDGNGAAEPGGADYQVGSVDDLHPSEWQVRACAKAAHRACASIVHPHPHVHDQSCTYTVQVSALCFISSALLHTSGAATLHSNPCQRRDIRLAQLGEGAAVRRHHDGPALGPRHRQPHTRCWRAKILRLAGLLSCCPSCTSALRTWRLIYGTLTVPS